MASRVTGLVRGAVARVRSAWAWLDESGVALVEYGVVVGVIALGSVVSLSAVSGKFNGLFNQASNSVQAASDGGSAPAAVTPPLADGSSVSSDGGSTNIPGGAVWFNAGTLSGAGGPGPAGAYTDTAVSGGCAFTSGGFTFAGTWSFAPGGYSASGYGVYHYVCS